MKKNIAFLILVFVSTTVSADWYILDWNSSFKKGRCRADSPTELIRKFQSRGYPYETVDVAQEKGNVTIMLFTTPLPGIEDITYIKGLARCKSELKEKTDRARANSPEARYRKQKDDLNKYK